MRFSVEISNGQGKGQNNNNIRPGTVVTHHNQNDNNTRKNDQPRSVLGAYIYVYIDRGAR